MSTTSRPIPICIVSLGCAKNLVDTEVMAGTLAQAGFALTPEPELARALLVNTCGFIKDARTEAQDEIRKALDWRAAAPRRRKVIVTGCLPQRDLPALHQRYPEVDLFLKLDDVPRIAEHLARLFAGEATAPSPEATPSHPSTWLYDHATPRLLLTPPTFAYVKIAEGCNHHCRFCAIPAIRGRQRSRAPESVLRECRNLLAMDVKELNLIAQDTSSYGHDRQDGTTLASLLRDLDQLEGDFWLRLLYTHPKNLTPDLVETIAAARHLVPYLDMPLQHISDPMLKAMGRGLGARETRALLDTLRHAIPSLTFRTTFLVGYPGETAADFQELLELVQSFRFDRLGVFSYSPEEGTPAARLTAGLVPPELAEERRGRLMAAQQAIALEKNQALVGQTIRVLLDHAESARAWIGRTAGDAPDVDNRVRVHGAAPKGGFREVRITAAEAYELEATPAR
ncbi:MAG: 30S ribosomal protein S12 methylthiotransferase RimO [Lentisphaeria bacterium]|jgi:ribosomal protein S12 methylthiotransferase